MNKQNYLALTTLKGINSQQFAIIIEKLSQTDDLFKLTNTQKIELGLPQKLINEIKKVDWQQVEKILHWEQASTDNHLLKLTDHHYPKILKEISDPPTLLFAKGNLSALDYSGIAIVGSRQASNYGLNNAFNFSKELTQKGFTIISGLAQGVDTKAHQGALDSTGYTIAVMGTGIDKVYPYRNRALAKAIENTGLLLSEFPLGSKPMPYHFPRRNRIISGLSLGIIIVEASLKSGSLITARLGLEQGREIFALPNVVHSPLSKGCNFLIKQGAKLIESTDDILEELSAPILLKESTPEKIITKRLEISSQNLVQFVGYEITSAHNIMKSSGLSAKAVNCQLIDLELKGQIKSVPGGYMRYKV